MTAVADSRGPIERGLPLALGLTLIAGVWLGGMPLAAILTLGAGVAGWEWQSRVRGHGLTRTGWVAAGWLTLVLAALSLILVRAELGLGGAIWVIAVPLAAMIGAAAAHSMFAAQDDRRPRRGPRRITTTHWVGALLAAWIVGASLADRIDLSGVPLWSGLPGAALAMGAVVLVRRIAPQQPPALVAAHRLRVQVLDRIAPLVPVALVAGILTAAGHLSVPIQ